MGITLRHDAAVASFGPSRQTRRFGQQLAIQQQQNKFTDQQREKDRWFDIQRQQAQNEFQTLRDRRMNNAENRRMQQNFNNQQALARDRQAAEMEMVRQQNQVTDQRWRDQQAAEQQQWMDRRNTEQMDFQAQAGQQRRQQDLASLKAGISQADLNTEGKAKASELLGDLKSIEAQRDSLRPDQYNKLVDEWMNRYNESALSNYVKPVPQMELELQNSFKDLGTGMGVFRQPDGKWQVLEIDPSKTKPAKGSDAMAQNLDAMPFESAMQDDTLSSSLLEKGKQNALAKISQTAKDENEARRQPTDAEIEEGMKQAYAEMQQTSRLRNKYKPTQAAPTTSQPPATAQPAPPQAAPVQPEQLPAPPAMPPASPEQIVDFPVPSQADVASGPTPQLDLTGIPGIPASQPAKQTVAAAPAKQPVSNASPAQMQQTLNEAFKLPLEQKIQALLPQVKLGIPQDEYTTIDQWMNDPEMKSEFEADVKAGRYKPEQYREYVLNFLDGILVKGMKDNISGMQYKMDSQAQGQAVLPKLYETAPKASTKDEALALDEQYFIAPDGTLRYKAR